MVLDSHTPVGQLVAEHPGWARVFDRLRIDYCCGGKAPFGEACAGLGLDVSDVLRQLEACDIVEDEHDRTDWSHSPIGALIDHIVSEHNEYLRRELPRLDVLVERVDQAHGSHYPRVRGLRSVFSEFRAELESHMQKEEGTLFPILRRLDEKKDQPGLGTEELRALIHTSEREHFEVAAALGWIRALTNDYQARLEDCATYRALLDGLAALEVDLRRHVHEENNLLFAKVCATEVVCRTEVGRARGKPRQDL
jgi:regulator of cell morphogenesis and NO signaling